MARPKKDIDEDLVAALAFDGARNSEIAFITGVDAKTIESRFSRLLDKKRAERRVKLRKLQMEQAEQGNATMLVWLGKNELDQTDKVALATPTGDLEVTISNGRPGAAAQTTP